MIRKLYKFSYVAGSIFVVLSMLMSLMPAFPVFAAQGSTKTSAGTCNNPVNKNHYSAGDNIILHFEGFEPNSTFAWQIEGNPGGASCDPGDVVASGTFDSDANGDGCVFAYTILPDDCGEYHVTVEGGKGDNYRVGEEEPTPDPDFTVTKTPNVSTVLYPGDNVTYTITVTNTGNQDLNLTQVGDNKFSDETIQNCINDLVGSTLAVGASLSCSFTGFVSGPEDSDHINTFEVRATNGQSNLVATDQATVHIDPIPVVPVLGVSVDKSADPTAIQQPGGAVTFSVLITNTSNVDVQLTSLSDDVFGDLNGQGTCSVPQSLAANGGTYSCDFTGQVTGSAGETHTNTITGVISYNNQDEQDEGSASVEITEGPPPPPPPSITVTKSANPTQITGTGGNVTFTIDVTNNSGFPVEITSFADTDFGNLAGVISNDCTVGTIIAAGDTYSCNFTAPVSGTWSSPHNNTMTVSVVDELDRPANDSDSAQVTFNTVPEITVTKTADPTSVTEPGGSVTFTFLITNTGADPVTLTSLVDNVFGDISSACNLPQNLAANGGTHQCSIVRNVVGQPGAPHNNTITATAVDGQNNQATDTDSANVSFNDILPDISVVKTAFPTSVDEPGGNVDFTFQINNNSAEPLTLDSLTDDVFQNLNQVTGCVGIVGQTIAAFGSISCTINQFVGGDAGQTHTNTVTAVASDDDGNSDQASDFANVDINNVPTVIQVTKTGNPIEVSEPGGDVTFTVLVENLTEEAITLTSLVDDVYGDLNGQGDCSLPAPIAASGSYSCQFTGPVNGDAGDLHINTVTATAVDNEGGESSDEDSEQVTVTDVLPSVQVTKSADPQAAPAPSAAVTYSIVVDNLSDEDVTLTELVDDTFGDLNGMGDCLTGGIIPAGGSYSCSFEKTIGGQGGEQHINIVSATIQDNEGNSANDNDDATVTFTAAPELILVDPCTVGCDLPNVEGQVCNSDQVNDYSGTINWTAYVDNTQIGGGTVNGVPAGECVTLSAPRQGDGLYSIIATLVDEGGRTIETDCGPIVCREPGTPQPTPTPGPPNPPTTGTPGPFIPVTGFGPGSGSLLSKLQNFGFALLSLGLVLHGFSLQLEKPKRRKKKS